MWSLTWLKSRASHKCKNTRNFFRKREQRYYKYSQNSETYADKDISSAFKLINVDNVQVLLLAAWETFASSANLSLTGKDFSISRTKYLLPMLYEADRSQLYVFPFLNLQSS